MILTRCFGRQCRLLFLALVFSLAAVGAHAEEIKLEAKLIWASNEPKSPKQEHKRVDDATAAKLRKIRPEWKYFFVEKKEVKTVPSRGSNRFTLSKACTLEITELEGPRVEVKLIGNGKPVHKTIKEIKKGSWFVYTGDDKHESAWMVIVTQLDEK
jgi:hypothetical protein